MNQFSMHARPTTRRDQIPQISLVMPCYNEEAALGETAPSLVRSFLKDGINVQLVLVDNGSTDRTGALIDALIADGMPVTKVKVEVNQGYGNGILRGLEHCRAPLVGYLCADGQVAPEDVVRTYRLMADREERVLAKVRRRFRQDSWRRKIVSIIYNGLLPAAFGWLGAIDINGSPKIFSRRNLDAMKLASKDWFLDAEIMIKAKALGLRTIEIDVEGYARHGGTSNVRPQTCLEFLRNIWRYRTGSYLRTWRRELSESQLQRPARVKVGQNVSEQALPTSHHCRAQQREGAAPFNRVRVLEQARFEDTRGFLQKVLTASQCGGEPPRGEVYVTAAHPGEAKGNHVHRRMGEWFAVVQGEGSVEISDPDTGEKCGIPISASRPRTIYVPAGLAHAVVNRGGELLICVAWAEAEHDPEDVFPCPVWPPETVVIPAKADG